MGTVQKAKVWLSRHSGREVDRLSAELAAVRAEREALARKSQAKILAARQERDAERTARKEGARRSEAKILAARQEWDALVATMAQFERARKVVQEDHNLLDDVLATMDTAELALLVGHSISLSEEMLVCGEGPLVDRVTDVLHAANRRVTRVEEGRANSARAGLDLVYVARAFEPSTYEAVSALRAQHNGRVLTLLQLFGAACLFRAIDALLGYHVQPNLNLLEYMTGVTILPPLARLNERFPLAGKRVLEFGPLDGAMTGNLVALGASEVTCVEVRFVNVIKMLAARHWLRWDHVRVLTDDMHTVDGRSHGRFDLVVAHGVYYHSIAPFRFMRNLVSLGDVVYLGLLRKPCPPAAAAGGAAVRRPCLPRAAVRRSPEAVDANAAAAQAS